MEGAASSAQLGGEGRERQAACPVADFPLRGSRHGDLSVELLHIEVHCHYLKFWKQELIKFKSNTFTLGFS